MAGMAGGMDGLSEHEQQEVQEVMARLDMEQTQRLFATVTQHAFKECVHSFRGRALEKKESQCIENIVTKFNTHFQRINVRFGEEFMARAQQAAMAAQQGQPQQ